MYLSVIIPAYNEEKRLGVTLHSIADYLRRQSYDWEIVVVSDGSTDGTAQVVREAQQAIPQIRLIDNKENHGKGYVVRQGMLEAKGQYRLFMDADNSVTIEQIENFWPWFSAKNGKGCDIVIGSIGVEGAQINEQAGWHRRFLGTVSKMIIRIVLWLPINDTQRGFKCFSASTIQPVFSRQTINRWGFDFEILYIAKKLGFKIKEVPVVWNNQGESKVKLSGYIRTFQELVRVRLNAASGKYR